MTSSRMTTAGVRRQRRLSTRRLSSSISGFHKLNVRQRLRILKNYAVLTDEEISVIRKCGSLNIKTADMMIENVIGTTHLPLGIATNFMINKKDYLIPMALEEPSVVAAASYAAKLARHGGGFTASSDLPLMFGQAQIVGLTRWKCIRSRIALMRNKKKILELANRQDSIITKLGGGAKNIEARVLKTSRGYMLIVHLIVDVRDAMGANLINTMLEAISPCLEELTGGRVRLRIISNLAVMRTVKARAVWKNLKEDVVNGILDAYAFAEADQFRCTTHNKGVMNGIDAVAIATGNDFRAIESAAHSYASFNKKNKYRSLTRYEKDKNGNLIGMIEIPIAAGIVGGATRTHPVAPVAIKILGIKSSQELAEVMACVGLANNFAALHAMVKDGIQKGHMRLHAKNIAIMAGAKGPMIQRIAHKISEEKNITVSRAKEVLGKLKRKSK